MRADLDCNKNKYRANWVNCWMFWTAEITLVMLQVSHLLSFGTNLYSVSNSC